MQKGDIKYLLVALIPALTPIFLFAIYPIGHATFTSLFKVDLIRPEKMSFIGLGNYLDVIHSYYFWGSVKSTVIFGIIALPLVIMMSLGQALILNEVFRFQKILQVLVLLPWAIPYAVSASMWKWIYEPNYGLLNGLLLQFGLIERYQPWLVQPWSAMILLAIAYVWAETPFPTVLLLASLQSVPHELYEAAMVDGAGYFERFRHITFTWLKPMFLVAVIYETLRTISAFDLIYVITAGGPADFTAIISFFTYRETFINLNLGRATALCLMIVVVSLVLIYGYLKSLKIVRLRG